MVVALIRTAVAAAATVTAAQQRDSGESAATDSR